MPDNLGWTTAHSNEALACGIAEPFFNGKTDLCGFSWLTFPFSPAESSRIWPEFDRLAIVVRFLRRESPVPGFWVPPTRVIHRQANSSRFSGDLVWPMRDPRCAGAVEFPVWIPGDAFPEKTVEGVA